MKKFMSLLLVCCMLLGVLPFSASAETTIPTSQADSIRVVFAVNRWQAGTIYPGEYPIQTVKINPDTQTATFNMPENNPVIVSANIFNALFFKWACYENDAFGSKITADGTTITIHNPVPGKTYVFHPMFWRNFHFSYEPSAYEIIIDDEGLVFERDDNSWVHMENDLDQSLNPGDVVTFTLITDENHTVKGFSAIDENRNHVNLEVISIGNGKYQFIHPGGWVSIIATLSEITPNSVADNTTVSSLPNGYTSMKAQAPQGDVLLTITNDSYDTLANIYVPSVLGEAKDFVDNRSGWYKEAVDKASALSLFNGVSETEFAPNSPMTRGMWVTVLHNLSSKPSYGYGFHFSDVATGSWYDMPVQWAYSLGITSGTSATTFSPLQNITREQMVTMLYRYAKLIGVDSDNRASLSGFSDSDKISSYAYDAMRWAVAEGFITGMGDGTVDPKGNSTRAQVATVLTKFVEYIAGRDVTDPPTVPLSTQNGYYICPICKYVNKEGTPCRACSTIDQAKPEEYCPTCGGGYDVGGVESWIHCRYCDEDFAGTQGPYYSCSQCHKTGLWPLSLDPETQVCIDCLREEAAGSFGYCETCGVSLIKQETENCAPNRCSNCSVCKYCSASITKEDYNEKGDYYCESCSWAHEFDDGSCCLECGVNLANTASPWEGLCWNCAEKEGVGKICALCLKKFTLEEAAANGNVCDKCGCDILVP